MLLSDGWDIWKVPVAGGQAVNLTRQRREGKDPLPPPFRLDPDERGIDLSAPVYISAYGEWTKKGGIGLIEPGKPGVRMLQWGDASYSQLMKAKSADVYLYTRETVTRLSELLLSECELENGKQITDANPQQKDFLWPSGVKLVDYTSTRGEKLQAALLPSRELPARQALPDHRLYLREAVAGRECLSAARLQRLQHRALHQQRLRRARAGHRL